MIGLGSVYTLTGVIFALYAVFSLRDPANPRRWKNAAFWGLFALSFLAGDQLGDLGNGLLVLAMVLVAGIGGLGLGRPATTTPAAREASAARYRNRLFIPALALPLVTLSGTLLLKRIVIAGQPLIDPAQATLISLSLGSVTAVTLGLWLLRQPLSAPLQEGRRLMDAVGWAALLPQMLAALGAVFALAGVGQIVGRLASDWLAIDNRYAVVAAYTLGMAAFTMVMGNAFAAFPVMTAGIGLPLIVQRYGGDPVIMSAVGMLSGFCGTLMTPMAANFNLVPAALLELQDRNAVIKVQVPTALALLLFNTVLMALLVFPH